MLSVPRVLMGTSLILMSVVSGFSADEGTRQSGIEDKIPEEDLVTARMRKRMALQVSGGTFPSSEQSFEFEEFADEFGLKMVRRCLVRLLKDPEESIRNIAAQAGITWLTAADLDQPTMEALLTDSSVTVRMLGLQRLSDSELSLEPLFQVARDEQSDLQQFAVGLLPRLIINGNDTARAVFLEQFTKRDPQIVGFAVQLTGTLGPLGRFAEPQLRAALSDKRLFVAAQMSQFCLTGDAFQIRELAADSLLETGFVEDATMVALRDVCSSSLAEFTKAEDEQFIDPEPWLSAACTIAVWRRDFEPAREALFSRFEGPKEFFITSDTHLVQELLKRAPEAITGWEHGERICRRLVSTPEGRSYGASWSALAEYPAATTVFEPELQQLLQDEIQNRCPVGSDYVEEVIKFRASDGFTIDDLDYSLRLVGLRKVDDTLFDDFAETLSAIILENDMQRAAELMMFDYRNDPSIDLTRYRELLDKLPITPSKSHSRIRLEALLDQAEVR